MPGQNLQVQFLILISADPCGPVPSHVKTELTVTVPASGLLRVTLAAL